MPGAERGEWGELWASRVSQLHLRVLHALGSHGAGAGPEISFPLLWVHVDVVSGGSRPVAFPREHQGCVIEVFS